MKKFNQYLAYIAVFALCFTSCSKEESGITDSETAKLSFGAIVNDLAATSGSSRQALGEYPVCSTDDPSYVRIVLKQGETEVVGTSENPYRVDLAPGEIFTLEDAELELPAGNYILDYFAVYNAAGKVIWLAPRGGDFASFVDTPLPITIDLRAGVKKYVDVDVLCFDNRDVNLYGYQFFEIDTNAAVDFCFFANFCDGDGMHYPARYRLDVWLGTNANGIVLYSNRINTTDVNADGDFFARAVCVALPVNDGNRNVDYIFYQLTLLDWNENYGDVETDVITGTLSLADIEANFGDEGEVEYEHLRFGCGDDNGGVLDSDEDGIPDNIDNCPNEAGSVSNNGCPETACDQTDPALDCDNDGTPNRCDEGNPNWGTFDCDNDNVLNSADNCPGQAGPASNNGCPETACDQTDPALDCDNDGTLNRCDEDNPNWGTFDCDNDTVLNTVDDCPGQAGPASNDGCPETACDQTNPALDCDNDGTLNRCDTDNPTYWGTFDCDGDTIINSADNCPNEAGPASNNGCPEETCEIEEADAGCTVARLEGTTGWTTISAPGESPEFLALLSGGEPVASVTITVDGGNVVVIANMGFDFVLDDYLVEVSQNADGSGSVCVAENNVTPATGEDPDLFEIFNETSAFSYPVYVRITANVCE